MMISPLSYIAEYENDTFEQLLQERDCLIAEIHELEKIVYSEARSDEAWSICPQPDVRYQMNLDYLSELCAFISKKYNREIVWKDAEESIDDDDSSSTIAVKKSESQN